MCKPILEFQLLSFSFLSHEKPILIYLALPLLEQSHFHFCLLFSYDILYSELLHKAIILFSPDPSFLISFCHFKFLILLFVQLKISYIFSDHQTL